MPYYLDMKDAAVVAYYNNDDGVDYPEVEIHVNSMIQENSCHFLLTDNGMLISWQQAISMLCFSKDCLEGVMEDNFLTYLSILQCMRCDNVNPDTGGLYWGTMQVIMLVQKATGTPLKGIYPYPTKVKIGKHCQCNTLAHCRVQLVEQCFSNKMKQVSCKLILFGIASSQESNDDPPPSSFAL
jgi:hypothetical protein